MSLEDTFMKIKSFVITLAIVTSISACSTPTAVVVNPTPSPSASAVASAAPVASATPTATATPADPLQQLVADVRNGTESVALKATAQAATVSTGTYRPGSSSTTSTNATSFFVKVGDTVLAILKKGDTSAAEVKAEVQKDLNNDAKAAASILQRLYKDGGNAVEYDSQNWKTAYIVVKNLANLDYIREKGFIRNAAGTNLGSYEIHMVGDPIYDRNHQAVVVLKSSAAIEFTVNVNTAPQKMLPGTTQTITIESFKNLDSPQISISTPDEDTNVLKPLDDPKTGEAFTVTKKRIFHRVNLEDVRYLIEVNMLKK